MAASRSMPSAASLTERRTHRAVRPSMAHAARFDSCRFRWQATRTPSFGRLPSTPRNGSHAWAVGPRSWPPSCCCRAASTISAAMFTRWAAFSTRCSRAPPRAGGETPSKRSRRPHLSVLSPLGRLGCPLKSPRWSPTLCPEIRRAAIPTRPRPPTPSQPASACHRSPAACRRGLRVMFPPGRWHHPRLASQAWRSPRHRPAQPRHRRPANWQPSPLQNGPRGCA